MAAVAKRAEERAEARRKAEEAERKRRALVRGLSLSLSWEGVGGWGVCIMMHSMSPCCASTHASTGQQTLSLPTGGHAGGAER